MSNLLVSFKFSPFFKKQGYILQNYKVSLYKIDIKELSLGEKLTSMKFRSV